VQRRARSQHGPRATRRPAREQLHVLRVSLFDGPITEQFARRNPVVARTIEIRGDQTLDRLHRAIFDAFDREEEHLYEFQVGGKRPMDPRARRYGLPMALDDPFEDASAAGDVECTTIASLGLRPGSRFGYWFDFGDDWWHQIEVLAIREGTHRGRFPRITDRVGESPPQYIDWEEEEEEQEEEEEG